MIGRALGRRGLVRCCLPALGAGVLVLLWPAASSAQGTKETLSTLQVVTNRGFRLSLKATGNGDASDEFSALSIDLDKRSRESTESVSFRFTAGVAFAGSSDLSSAQINGNLLDGRGSINVAFSANSAASAVPVPKGCTGTPGSQRRGRLSGSLILNADRLGTVTLTTATVGLDRSVNTS